VLRNGPEVRSCPDFIAAVANKFICCSGHANVVSTSCAAKIVVVANKFFDITVIKKDMRFLPSVIRRPSVRHGSLGSLTAGGTKVTAGELALQRLANVPCGIARTLMLAHGFTHDLIAGLEQAELVTVVPDIATLISQLLKPFFDDQRVQFSAGPAVSMRATIKTPKGERQLS
jgi:hypothetical protein